MKALLFGLASPLPVLIAGSTAHADYIGYSGFEETYSITSSGTYDITVAGAQGGTGSGTIGGGGAIIDANVYLTAGTQLDMVPGGPGPDGRLWKRLGGRRWWRYFRMDRRFNFATDCCPAAAAQPMRPLTEIPVKSL